MGGLGRVADRVSPKNSTRGLKYSKARPHLRAYFFVATRPFLKRAGPAGRRIFLYKNLKHKSYYKVKFL